LALVGWTVSERVLSQRIAITKQGHHQLQEQWPREREQRRRQARRRGAGWAARQADDDQSSS